jgi:hypothetical protein
LGCALISAVSPTRPRPSLHKKRQQKKTFFNRHLTSVSTT